MHTRLQRILKSSLLFSLSLTLKPFNLPGVPQGGRCGTLFQAPAKTTSAGTPTDTQKNPITQVDVPSEQKPVSSSSSSTLAYTLLEIKPNASDAEILGITPEQLNDKNTVKTAYRKLSLMWHPDKWKTNDTVKNRLTSLLGNVSDSEKEAVVTEVMKLINAAYERHKE